MIAQHTPTPNDSILHAAQGNLAFLLSVIRCGEKMLHSDEEANVRRIIEELGKHELEERETAAERDRLKAEIHSMIENLATSLFPDSPIESARAEFMFTADGACQVIRKYREERDRLRALLDELCGAIETLQTGRKIQVDLVRDSVLSRVVAEAREELKPR